MPVIVVGADTDPGLRIAEALLEPNREVRAFVSDPGVGERLRDLGIKVALGDVSDETHIEAASINCFSAILLGEAAIDQRERSFAPDHDGVHAAWARGIAASQVTRAIWVIDGRPPAVGDAEVAVVSPADPELVAKVVALDDAQMIENRSSKS